jgi:hypothetical protein
LAVLAHPKIGTNSEILYYQAKALDMSGQKGKAAEVFLQIYARYPTSKHSQLAQQYLVSSSPGAFKGVRHYEARLLRAESLIDSGEYRPARVLLLALGKVSAPDPALAERRNLRFGEVEYRLGRASTAIPFLLRLQPQIRFFMKAPGRSLFAQARPNPEFLALRDRILKLYPDSPTQRNSAIRSRLTDVNYDSARSREAYLALYNAFPKGKYAERALWKLALFSYLRRSTTRRQLASGNSCFVSQSVFSQPGYVLDGRCYESLGIPEVRNTCISGRTS